MTIPPPPPPRYRILEELRAPKIEAKAPAWLEVGQVVTLIRENDDVLLVQTKSGKKYPIHKSKTQLIS